MAAAKQFVFDPAKAAGVAIPVKITYRYVFKIEEKIVKKTTADFEGHVRDRGTKKPIPNVRVAVDTGQQTLTGEDGKFSIPDVAPGEHSVTLSGEQLATVGTTETFEVAKKVDATYEVEPRKEKKAGDEDEEEIVVRAPRIKKQVVSTEVPAEQATRVPGTGGDVLKVVENLPGVARAAVGSGALVVWGAAAQDTRVYVEGVHVPRLYHDGGFRSIVSGDFVKSVELVPGGYGAGFGRGIGGLVTVSYKPLDDEGVHGSVAADTIDAAASVRAKIADHVHVAIAARKSYLDTVLNAVTSEDVGQIIPIPRYWDGQARVVYDFGPLETIEIGGIISSDRTTRNLVNPDPSLSTSQTTGTDFNRIYVRYEKHMPDGAVIEVTPSYGTNSTSLVNLYGVTPTDLTNDSQTFAMRATWRGPVAPFLRANVGFDTEVLASKLHRDGSIGAPPREGDKYVFGQPPPTQINFDSWNTIIASVAAFAEGDVTLFDEKLHIVPGARFEPFRHVDQQDAAIHRGQPQRQHYARGCSHRAAPLDPLLLHPGHHRQGSLRPVPPVAAGRGTLGGLRDAPAPALERQALPRRQQHPAHRDARRRGDGVLFGVQRSRRPHTRPEPTQRTGARPDEGIEAVVRHPVSPSASSRSGRSSAGSATASCGARGATHPTWTGASSTTTRLTSLPPSAPTTSAPASTWVFASGTRRVIRARPSSDPTTSRPPELYEPALRAAQLDPDPAVRVARRTPGQAVQDRENRCRGVSGPTERDQPFEPRRDRVQYELHAARVHHGFARLASHRREVVVVKRARVLGTSRIGLVASALAFALGNSACKPDLDQTVSIVNSTRVLAP